MSQASRRSLIRMLTVVGAVLWALTGAPSTQGIASVVVNSTGDDTLVNGNCTFREAIIAANENVQVDECLGMFGGTNDNIYFDVGTGTPRIDIAAGNPLPQIGEWVNIYGRTGGADRIEIHGPGGPLVSGDHGLHIAPEGAGTTINALVINNSADDGIFIDADEVTVLDSFIGTDSSGTSPEPNQGFGIQVRSNGVHIGQTVCGGRCNLISGNKKAQVLLDFDSSGARVQGNYIGMDASGFSELHLTNVEGVIDMGQSNLIGGGQGTTPGGSCTGDCNVISGNGGLAGVLIDVMAGNSQVKGNFIGTDVSGTTARSNGQLDISLGVLSRSPGVVIGGATPEERNVISGNRGAQVQVRGMSPKVIGNYIGTNSAGTFSIFGGYGLGVYLADAALIGGTIAGEENVISGNTGSGVDVQQSTNTLMINNLIGLAADGSTPLGNGGSGVFVWNAATVTTIGSGNKIAHNLGAGVRVDGATTRLAWIRANSIYSNGGSGILLSNGSNDGVLPPVITGTDPIAGTACPGCTVDIYSDSVDEGRVYEGPVTADGAGNWTFPSSVIGPNITAVATDPAGNTSRFSQAVVVANRVQGDVDCDGVVTFADFDFLIKYAAGLNDGTTPGTECPDLSGEDTIGPWGDTNCDGSINALDALYVLAYLAGTPLPPTSKGCPPVGSPIVA